MSSGTFCNLHNFTIDKIHDKGGETSGTYTLTSGYKFSYFRMLGFHCMGYNNVFSLVIPVSLFTASTNYAFFSNKIDDAYYFTVKYVNDTQYTLGLSSSLVNGHVWVYGYR